MSNEIRIEIVENPGEDLCEAVNYQLRTHNQTSNPVLWEERGKAENQPKPLKIFAFAKDRAVTGGLFGTTQFSWLKIDVLAIRKDWRGKGVGRALLARAEEVAKVRGCRYAYTDTMEYGIVPLSVELRRRSVARNLRRLTDRMNVLCS